MEQHNVVLIFSGYNPRGIIAFCRFCNLNQIKFFIIAANEEDLINFTEFKHNIISVRENAELNVRDILNYKLLISKRVDFNQIIIFPSTEYLNRYLLENREILESNDFVIPLTTIELYSEISDKYSFGELCKNYGITIPTEYKDPDKLLIPFVAKPKSYFNGKNVVSDKPILIRSESEYELFESKFSRDEFYYQEFVGGNSYYLLYYFTKDLSYSVYSQQNLMQQDNGLSILAASSSNVHQNSIAESFARIFIEKKFHGLLMIEIKEWNDKYYMIEANPRLWGPSQLILDSGMDLFYKFSVDYHLLDNSKIIYPRYKLNTKYFWSGGIIEDQYLKNKICLHGLTGDQFLRNYKDWILSDVYMRDDTMELFLKETKLNYYE